MAARLTPEAAAMSRGRWWSGSPSPAALLGAREQILTISHVTSIESFWTLVLHNRARQAFQTLYSSPHDDSRSKEEGRRREWIGLGVLLLPLLLVSMDVSVLYFASRSSAGTSNRAAPSSSGSSTSTDSYSPAAHHDGLARRPDRPAPAVFDRGRRRSASPRSGPPTRTAPRS